MRKELIRAHKETIKQFLDFLEVISKLIGCKRKIIENSTEIYIRV